MLNMIQGFDVAGQTLTFAFFQAYLVLSVRAFELSDSSRGSFLFRSHQNSTFDAIKAAKIRQRRAKRLTNLCDFVQTFSFFFFF